MEASAIKIQAAFRGATTRRLVALQGKKLANSQDASLKPDAYEIEMDALVIGLEQRRLTRGLKGSLFEVDLD